jgi:hypothetical protein
MTAAPDTREIRDSASEIKFSVSLEQAEAIRHHVRGLLAPDPWAAGPSADQYQVTTIYFDTGEFDVYGRRRSFRRAKYRIRRYGHSEAAFLERKLRTDQALVKRRTMVRTHDLPLLTGGTPDRSWPGWWFQQRLIMRKLQPACQLRYERTARVGMGDFGPIRLTIDEGLAALATKAVEFTTMESAGRVSVDAIVEMKFRGPVPAVFKQIVEAFALKPARISKYRLGIEATRLDAVVLNA